MSASFCVMVFADGYIGLCRNDQIFFFDRENAAAAGKALLRAANEEHPAPGAIEDRRQIDEATHKIMCVLAEDITPDQTDHLRNALKILKGLRK